MGKLQEILNEVRRKSKSKKTTTKSAPAPTVDEPAVEVVKKTMAELEKMLDSVETGKEISEFIEQYGTSDNWYACNRSLSDKKISGSLTDNALLFIIKHQAPSNLTYSPYEMKWIMKFMTQSVFNELWNKLDEYEKYFTYQKGKKFKRFNLLKFLKENIAFSGKIKQALEKEFSLLPPAAVPEDEIVSSEFTFEGLVSAAGNDTDTPAMWEEFDKMPDKHKLITKINKELVSAKAVAKLLEYFTKTEDHDNVRTMTIYFTDLITEKEIRKLNWKTSFLIRNAIFAPANNSSDNKFDLSDDFVMEFVKEIGKIDDPKLNITMSLPGFMKPAVVNELLRLRVTNENIRLVDSIFFRPESKTLDVDKELFNKYLKTLFAEGKAKRAKYGIHGVGYALEHKSLANDGAMALCNKDNFYVIIGGLELDDATVSELIVKYVTSKETAEWAVSVLENNHNFKYHYANINLAPKAFEAILKNFGRLSQNSKDWFSVKLNGMTSENWWETMNFIYKNGSKDFKKEIFEYKIKDKRFITHEAPEKSEYSEVSTVLYDSTGDDKFLSAAAKDIFLF